MNNFLCIQPGKKTFMAHSRRNMSRFGIIEAKSRLEWMLGCRPGLVVASLGQQVETLLQVSDCLILKLDNPITNPKIRLMRSCHHHPDQFFAQSVRWTLQTSASVYSWRAPRRRRLKVEHQDDGDMFKVIIKLVTTFRLIHTEL